jgi:hypothetical protein
VFITIAPGDDVFDEFHAAFRRHLAVNLSSTTTTGARPHAPRHATVSTVNSMSSVVFFCLPAEAFADGVEDRDGILHVAGRAVAQADEVLALRLDGEVRVKRGHAEHARRRDVQRGGDIGQHSRGR